MRTRRMIVAGGAATAAFAGAGAVGYRRWRDREPPAPPSRDDEGRDIWSNWSGLQTCYPALQAAPASEDELVHLLRTAPGPIRAVGAGHSFMPLAPTAGALVSLDRMSGLVSHDPVALTARVRAGTRLGELGPALAAVGQEMPNLPDINAQALGGALATGTHGTGRALKALHGEVTAFRLATATGEILDCSAESHPEVFQAARVGLGAFGIITEATLRNQPLTRLHKRVELHDWEALAEAWPDLQARHRNVEFYVVPFSGKGALITGDPAPGLALKPRRADEETSALLDLKRLRDVLGPLPFLRRLAAGKVLGSLPPEDQVDLGWKLLSNDRPIRFNEMEFHLPRDTQMAALREVVAAVETHRNDVFFPIEVRTIAADDAWLSPFYGRDSGSIAVHAYYKDDHRFFFELIEPILRRHGGRPHWGKLNSLTAPDFAALYPRFADAMAVRRALDPEGRLLNPYLRRALVAA